MLLFSINLGIKPYFGSRGGGGGGLLWVGGGGWILNLQRNIELPIFTFIFQRNWLFDEPLY